MAPPLEITRLEMTGLEAKRFQRIGDRAANVRIDQNSSITQLTALSDSEGSAAFRFCVNYSGLGYLNIEGEMLFRGPAEEMASCWIEKGQIPSGEANVIHSAIVSSCMVSAVLLAREAKLPPPFPMPRVNVKRPPPPGPEVA